MSNVDLPPEVIGEILSHLPTSSIRACLQVNQAWYHAVIPRLYAAPRIRDTETYLLLVDALVTYNTALGRHVRVLDLRRVSGTQHTSRLPDLLSRTPRLHTLKTPQAAMTAPLIASLAGLKILHVLDLECVNDRFELSRVIHAVLDTPVQSLLYPRCAVSTLYPIKQYPTTLRHFALRGGLRDEFLKTMASESHPNLQITTVLVSHAPSLTPGPVRGLLRKWKGLRELKVSWPLPRFGNNDMDDVLGEDAQGVRELHMALDYISARFFETDSECLETLVLDYSGVGKRGLIKGDDLVDALECSQQFPALKKLGLTERAKEQLFLDKETYDELLWAAKTRHVQVYTVANQEDDEHDETIQSR